MWELILIDNQQTIHITRFASVIQLQKKKERSSNLTESEAGDKDAIED
jgi:hypothetical protein